MAETLLTLLSQLDATHILQSQEQLTKLAEENPLLFITSIIEILKQDSVSAKIKGNACVIAGNYFPNISKLPEQEELHPFNVFTENNVNELIDLCFELMTTMDPVYRHHPAVLLGKIGSLYVHRNFENSLLNRLSSLLQQGENPQDLDPVCKAINIILVGYDPSDEEIQNLITGVFGHFTSTDNLEASVVVLDTLIATVESIVELLADPEFSTGVVSVLLALLENDVSIRPSLECWNRLADITPSIVAEVSEHLVLTCCKVLQEIKEENTLMQACMLINTIADLEYNDREMQLETIANNAEVILASLVGILSTIDTNECITPDMWTPAIATFKAVKVVISLNCDNMISTLETLINTGIVSDSFAEKDVALKLLASTICNTTDVTFSSKYLEALNELVTDESPCVRQRALHCIRKGIETMANSEKFKNENTFKESVIKLANDSIGFLELITDENVLVASEVCQLMKVLTQVEGFTSTEQILEAILEHATSISEGLYKNPFDSFNDIIQYGSADAGASVLPTVIELYANTLESGENFWICHQLAETIQVFCYRDDYRSQILQSAETLLPLFVKALQTGDQYLNDALLPIAAVARAIGNHFSPYLEETVSIYDEVLGSDPDQCDPDALYNATYALDMLINAGFDVGDKGRFINVIVAYLSNLSTMPNNRRAFLNLLSTLSQVSFDSVSSSIEALIPYLRVFAKTLNVEANNDQGEAEIIANTLSKTMSNVYQKIDPEAALGVFDIGADILTYFSNFPPLFKQSRTELLRLALTMSTLSPEAVMEIINQDEEQGIVNLFMDAISNDESKGDAEKLFKTLNLSQ